MLQKFNRRSSLLATLCSLSLIVFLIPGCNTASTTDTTKCGACMAYNNVRPASKLDVNLLRAMTYNYQVGAGGAVNANTRSVWLSLDKLKQFIYEIESKTCNNCSTSKLGARIYFGNYPADIDWINGFKNDLNNPGAPDGDFRAAVMAGSASNEYALRTSIFIVPTIYDGTKNVDFDPADNSNSCRPGYDTVTFIRQAASAKGDYNDPNYFLHTSLGISVTAIAATNHGDACPPLPPSGGGCPAKGSYTGFDH